MICCNCVFAFCSVCGCKVHVNDPDGLTDISLLNNCKLNVVETKLLHLGIVYCILQ